MGRLSRKEAEDPQGPVVVEYRPKEFPVSMSGEAKGFLLKQNNQTKSHFKINPLIADRAGISKLKADALEREIEKQALVKLKEVQERAYREAFELGLLEGTEKAFEERKEEFENRLNYLDSFIHTIEDLKVRLLQENETQIVTLIYQIGKALALKQITEDRSVIVEVVKKIMEDIQSDERIIIRIPPDDHKFIQDLKTTSPKDAEVFSKVKLEVDPNVKSGGCLLDTNFGSIDASIEHRVTKAWETLRARAPKIQPSEILTDAYPSEADQLEAELAAFGTEPIEPPKAANTGDNDIVEDPFMGAFDDPPKKKEGEDGDDEGENG
ncbi:MAG: hypothetical protein KDD22_04240 [Bdellovibrionales bacterium]|nr:hypothetical protein [Bdellovibrionales bacterium]